VIANKIRAIREARKLSQSDFAARLGVTQKAVSLWETGSACPRADKLAEIVRVLGCRIDDLFEENEEVGVAPQIAAPEPVPLPETSAADKPPWEPVPTVTEEEWQKRMLD